MKFFIFDHLPKRDDELKMDVVKKIDQVCLASSFDSFWSSLLFDVLAPIAMLS
jgi:hypothetical protein